MNKEIKNLISEAFKELYLEMIGEAEKLNTQISDSDVEALIQKALKSGVAIPSKFGGDDIKSRNNFDRIIESLVLNYKKTKNPNAKSSIQLSYRPSKNSKMYNSVVGGYAKEPEIQDAIDSAYEQIVLEGFDKTIEAYQPGTSGIGAMFTKLMRLRIINFFNNKDRKTGRLDTVSIDRELGDNGGTFADRLADDSEDYKSKEEGLVSLEDLINVAINLLYNTFDENGNETGKRNTFALEQLINKKTPKEIFDMVNNNPEFPPFAEERLISQIMKRFLTSAEVKDISDTISKIYTIDFDLSKIDYSRDLKRSSIKKQNLAQKGFAQDEEGNQYQPQYTKSSAEEYEELTGEPYWESYKGLNINVLMERILRRVYKK